MLKYFSCSRKRKLIFASCSSQKPLHPSPFFIFGGFEPGSNKSSVGAKEWLFVTELPKAFFRFELGPIFGRPVTDRILNSSKVELIEFRPIKIPKLGKWSYFGVKLSVSSGSLFKPEVPHLVSCNDLEKNHQITIISSKSIIYGWTLSITSN